MKLIRLLAVICALLGLTVATLAYDAENRRDPFVMKSPEPKTPPDPEQQKTGLAKFLIDEVTLDGISQLNGKAVAVLTGTDEKGYFARVGDTLADGTLQAIDFDQGIVTFKRWLEGSQLVQRKLHP